MSMEIPSRDPWLTPDRRCSAGKCARPQPDRRLLFSPAPETQLPPLPAEKITVIPTHRARGRADDMPRSFLVKKHQSSKKPKYEGLNSTTEEDSHDTQEDALLQKNIPLHLHCPTPSQFLQHRVQSLSSSLLPLRAEGLHNPSIQNTSSMSFVGNNRTSSAEDHERVESCTKLNLEIQHPRKDHRRRESLVPPALPLLALFPAVPPGSSSQENFECLDFHGGHLSFSGLAKHNQLQCGWSTKKSFGCKYCEKEYVSLGALKMHIRTHTLPCVCKLCGKAFSRPWLLQGHIRTHTGEKPFTCFHCSRAFADRSNLRAHLQTHSEVKKYQCASCFKTFSRISLLAKHQEASCPLS